jgi:hypothetical protein
MPNGNYMIIQCANNVHKMGKPYPLCARLSWIFFAFLVSLGRATPFQTMQLPQTKAMHAFHPSTTHGKLNAVITPTIPRGFQTSIII